VVADAVAVFDMHGQDEFGVPEDREIRAVCRDDHLPAFLRGLKVTDDARGDAFRVEMVFRLVKD
jgi:hypothetical protein